jgi:hemin uptake protein HemP
MPQSTAAPKPRNESPRPRGLYRNVTVRDGRINSRTLLNEDGTLWIRHGDSFYQLRRTATGKLILTK